MQIKLEIQIIILKKKKRKKKKKKKSFNKKKLKKIFKIERLYFICLFLIKVSHILKVFKKS